MPTILPQRVLRGTMPLDPAEVNADFREPTEKRSGLLDEHDFKSTIRSGLSVAPGAYYAHYRDATLGNPGWGVPAAYARPVRTAGVLVPGHGGWEAIANMTRTVSTGTGLLYIVARLQWIAFGLLLGAWQGAQGGKARIQFAIAVDGRVLPWTVTGQNDPYRKNPWAIRAVTHRSVGAGLKLPGSHQPRDQICGAMNRDMGSQRLETIYPVQPGSHVVQIMARRTFVSGGVPFDSGAGTGDAGVYVFNRELFVQRLNTIPASAQTLSAAEIGALQPEDAFSQANIATARVDVLRTAYNAIPAGALARGAFNHVHLPSAVKDWAQATIVPAGSPTTNDFYPGFGVATLAGARTGATGWWLLDDGAGNNLRTDQTHAAAFDCTTDSTFLILANVHARHVENVPQENHSFGLLTLFMRQGGSNVILNVSEAALNNWADWGYTLGLNSLLNEEEDIPLMAVVSMPANPTPVDWFGVYGAAFDDSGARAELEWGRGVITVLQFRDIVTP